MTNWLISEANRGLGRAFSKGAPSRGDKPPLRRFLGVAPTLLVPGTHRRRLAEWDAGKDMAVAATQVQNG